MDKFDIIGQLYRKAKSNGWAFCAGDEFYQNIAATQENMTDGQLVLTAQFNCTPTFLNSRVTRVVYSGSIMLGRKFDDDGTASSLDEDYMDKYNNRLFELMSLLANFIGTFECENGLTVDSAEFVNAINKFDTNIDFVGGNITFSQQ